MPNKRSPKDKALHLNGETQKFLIEFGEVRADVKNVAKSVEQLTVNLHAYIEAHKAENKQKEEAQEALNKKIERHDTYFDLFFWAVGLSGLGGLLALLMRFFGG